MARKAVELQASDIHLVAGSPAAFRIHGEIHVLGSDHLNAETLQQNLLSVCTAAEQERLARELSVDLAVDLQDEVGTIRIRLSIFCDKHGLGGCIRIIPSQIPDLEWTNLPRSVVDRLLRFRNGLILVSGVTGSGKTTTLAVTLKMLAEGRGCRIITIEDPIEYRLPMTTRSILSQHEVGRDVHSFADGLRVGLRLDPDVILVGEIRDRETAQMAVSAAETGHLVFSTVHSRDSKSAISRITDLYPQENQAEIRALLALSLRAVVSQHLLPSIDTKAKRELAIEVLYNNLAISSAIRTGRLETIDNNIKIGKNEGMLTMDDSIRKLMLEGKISRETAVAFVSDAKSL